MLREMRCDARKHVQKLTRYDVHSEKQMYVHTVTRNLHDAVKKRTSIVPAYDIVEEGTKP